MRANPHDLWQRTRRDKNRPLLQTDDPRGKLEALYDVRDPLYQECAHFVVETGRPTVNALVNMVLMQLEMAGVVKPADVIMSAMITVNVELGERAYPIHIGADLIGQTDLFAPHIAGSSVAIVTNSTVDPLYGDALRARPRAARQESDDRRFARRRSAQELGNAQPDLRRAARPNAPIARPR